MAKVVVIRCGEDGARVEQMEKADFLAELKEYYGDGQPPEFVLLKDNEEVDTNYVGHSLIVIEGHSVKPAAVRVEKEWEI